jgi:hypothetical protein
MPSSVFLRVDGEVFDPGTETYTLVRRTPFGGVPGQWRVRMTVADSNVVCHAPPGGGWGEANYDPHETQETWPLTPGPNADLLRCLRRPEGMPVITRSCWAVRIGPMPLRQFCQVRAHNIDPFPPDPALLHVR